MAMIEFVLEALGSWIQFGSDKGWSGKIRGWLTVAMFCVAAAMVLLAYVANFPDMSMAMKIVWAVLILLLGSVLFGVYWAIRRQSAQPEHESE